MYDILDDYQKKAVKFTLKRRAAALFFEQGTGKTFITGGIISKLKPSDLTGLLIVPLANIETTWVATLSKYLPHINLARSIEEFRAMPNPRILLLHYEALQNRKLVAKLARMEWHFCGFDESQRIKDRNTHASRAAKRFGRKSLYRLILSGTPMDNSEIDLWAQFRFVAPQCLGDRWGDFDDEYLTPIGYMGYKRKFKKSKEKQFIRAIKPYSMRVGKEVLNLPPLEIIPYEITMWSKQRKLYDTFERDAVVELGKGQTLSSGLEVTTRGKLHQICGGYVFDDDGNSQYVGSVKKRGVMSLIKEEEVKLPFIIFCRYTAEVLMLQRKLSPLFSRVEVYHGKVKKKLRPQIIRDFQSGAIDILILQIRTGGVGVDLFASCYGVIYSSTYSWIDYDQAIARLHRRGQTRPVKFFFLIVKDTIDGDIHQALNSKGSVSKAILKRLKRKKAQWLKVRKRQLIKRPLVKRPARKQLPQKKKRKLPSMA